jgi:hypothetical protein
MPVCRAAAIETIVGLEEASHEGLQWRRFGSDLQRFDGRLEHRQQ